MDSVLISLVVTAGFFVVTAALGFRLGRSAKPYAVAKLAAHIFLFLFVLSGVIAWLTNWSLLQTTSYFPRSRSMWPG